MEKGALEMVDIFVRGVVDIHLPPRAHEFVARRTFVRGSLEKGIELAFVGEHFTEHLLHNTEGALPRLLIQGHELLVEARSRPHKRRSEEVPGAYDALGGEQALIPLSAFWQAVHSGVSREGYAAFVRGKDSKVFGVRAWVIQNLLHVESGGLDRPYPWAPKCRFLTLRQ